MLYYTYPRCAVFYEEGSSTAFYTLIELFLVLPGAYNIPSLSKINQERKKTFWVLPKS